MNKDQWQKVKELREEVIAKLEGSREAIAALITQLQVEDQRLEREEKNAALV